MFCTRGTRRDSESSVPVAGLLPRSGSTLFPFGSLSLRLPMGHGVPLGMRRIGPENLHADPSDHSVAADVLLRQEPDEEEDEEEDEDDGKEDDDDDDQEDDGYSE